MLVVAAAKPLIYERQWALFVLTSRAERTIRLKNLDDPNVRDLNVALTEIEIFMRIRSILFVALVVGSAALLLAETRSKIASNPAFDKMKTLAGKWEGTAMEDGKALPTNARCQLISDGSALMGWLNEGIADEMVTMFHMDGSDLMATRYCSAHNQPRMVLAPSRDANKLVFKFKDGTNIEPDAGHMQAITFMIDGPNHHTEDWTYLEKGKETAGHFDFHRK
jgi:hypothetical protein